MANEIIIIIIMYRRMDIRFSHCCEVRPPKKKEKREKKRWRDAWTRTHDTSFERMW